MGIMTTIFVIIINIIFITIIGLGAQVELYHILRSKPLATGRPTSNSHGRGRSRPEPQGKGAGGTHTTWNHSGGGEDTMGWGGRGGLAALHHIYCRCEIRS